MSFFVLEKSRTARFENLNAARMSAAGYGSTEPNKYFSSYREEKCNQIWPVPALITEIYSMHGDV